MRKILYVTNIENPFTQIDREILEARYQVRSIQASTRNIHLFPQMWESTCEVDLVVAWFASWHTLPAFLAARLRNIPRILISGGYDVANEPEIDYGLRRGGVPKLITDIVFRLTDHALLFSEYAYNEALCNTPLTTEQCSKLYLGLPDEPIYEEAVVKEAIAFTVGTIDKVTAYRKGIQAFIEAAQYLPNVPFIVVGKSRDDYIKTLKRIASDNVEFTGFMSANDLIKLRQRAKVYVQVSRHEGFGLALAEAMQARCIPVVSHYGSLPEVAGKTGIVVGEITPYEVAQAIQQGLQASEQAGETARQYVLTQFPLEHRANELYQLIDKLI